MITMPTIRLSPMQEAVIRRLVAGDSIKQAARRLGIAKGTAMSHIARAKDRAGLNGPVHRLVVWYLKEYRRSE